MTITNSHKTVVVVVVVISHLVIERVYLTLFEPFQRRDRLYTSESDV